jgi:hypothetical protein
MKLINSNEGVIVMGDIWDYKLRKVEMAWELALRIIPKSPGTTGKWTEENYLEHAQKIIKESHDVVDAIFKADKVRD